MSLIKECIQIRFNETEYLPWDNPDNIVSVEVEAYAIKIKDFILAFAFLIGGPANIINMAVFYRQGLQDRVNLCLFSLAVFDEMYLTSGILIHGENIILHIRSQDVKTAFNLFMANNNLVFLLGSGFVSCTLSAIIACERCYCVLRPLKYQTLLRTRTMAVIIVAIFVGEFGLFFIVSYRFWIVCMYDPVTGATWMKVTGGEFYNAHKQFVDYLDSVVFGAGLPGGMMVVVIAATTTTTVKLRQIVTWRTETSSALSPREVALTKMLIGSSIFFIICTSPACFFRVAFLFLPEMSAVGRHQNFYLATLWVLEGVYFLNSALNFSIYYSMGSRYRETFWALFRRKTHQKERDELRK
ncbi:uncharacterized protein LOC143289689 [Babylonia areolata]|uniref:uncharacterized protein LOC143289689 n=1 Tax=Babylonia areolata TaxID=304850 RepID=UPI003FD69B7F